MIVDYAPLNETASPQDKQAFYDSFADMPARRRLRILAGALAVIAIGLIGMTITMIIGGDRKNLLPLFFLVIFIVIGIIHLLNAAIIPKKWLKLYLFARRNNLITIFDRPEETYAGLLFEEGRGRKIYEAVRFPDGLEIGNFKYVTGSGKSRTTHVRAYLKMKLRRNLPHMVLDATSNNVFGGRISNLPDFGRDNVRLKLEGTFNDHFNVYVPKGYERDALYVFTPDVMAALVDFGSDYNIEIIDDELIVFSVTSIDLTDPAKFETAFKMISAIDTELIDQSDYYADARVGDRTLNVIAPEGSDSNHAYR